MKNIYDAFERITSNHRIRISFVSTFCMAMVTHAYSYFNASFTMDRFRWFWNGSRFINMSSLASGKWFATFFDFLNQNAYLPWLNGLLAMLCMAYSVYVICSTLYMNRDLGIWLTAGLIVTDYSVILGHFYFTWGFVEALALVCISIHVWSNTKMSLWRRIVFEGVFVGLSLATYGSYTSVGLTVVILACMIMIIEGTEIVLVIKRGGEYIVSFLLGMGIYYAVLRILLAINDVEMLSYMGEDKLISGTSISEVIYLIGIAYKNAILRYIGVYRNGYRLIPQWLAIVILIIATILLFLCIYKNKHLENKKTAYILLAVLLAVFPLAAGSIYVMAFGNVHGLMTFTFVILYVGFVKLSEMVFEPLPLGTDDTNRLIPNQINNTAALCSSLMAICIIVLIYRGVLTANMAYSRLDNLQTVSEGIANRVLERIENCEGFEGDETVVFVGDVTQSWYFSQSRYQYSDALKLLDGVLGVDKDNSNVFLYFDHFIMFMEENTETNLEMVYYDEEIESNYSDGDRQIVQDMPCFPADGSVRKIGSTIVVKFTE